MIATEGRGFKHLIKFLSGVRGIQFEINAILWLEEQRGIKFHE